MATIVAQELKKWRDSLKADELNEYEITVANVILNNFEELKDAGGTAAGKRIMKFVEMVNSKNGGCDKDLIDIAVKGESSEKRIKRISSLEVESFRGFASSRKFDLGKQYVLLYGPNGSGKTSFSEALEYSLLGSIEEADADNIKLHTYIKNTSTKKAISPVIRCIYEDGSEGIAEEDYETYRFSFVEKNRITDFSHISGLNQRNQSERIAALFGLSEFSSFVSGFSRNIDSKYLQTTSITEKTFQEQLAIRNAKNEQLAESQEALAKLKQEAKKQIESLAEKDSTVTNIQQAISYYDDAKTGILTVKLQDKDRLQVSLLEYQSYLEIKQFCIEIKDCFACVIEKRERLADKALEVNYKNFYEIISKMEETTECPACGTDISKTMRNPYVFAKEKICEFKEIDEIKTVIHEKSYECANNIGEVILLIEKSKDILALLNMQVEKITKVATSDIEKMEANAIEWLKLADNIIGLDDEDIEKKIAEYNSIATAKNEAYLKEVEELKGKEKELVALSTQIGEKEKQLKDNISFINEFDKNSQEIQEKIKAENLIANYNIKIIDSYKAIIDNLFAYVEMLPKLIAQDLEDKIVDYYNVINCGDADFEMLSSISLPIGDSNKLSLTFKDGSSSDALQVLSEGHVKILGLSILLAKAIKDQMNFIIFDDIVNAIDDEHRNGVANLLISHDDFKDIQIILSTHGDQFITKLKDKIGPSKSSKDTFVYKFLPADSLQERGVVVEYSDAKTPIETAKKKYGDNELKDAASKCRQAMESVSYNLWNKISKTANGQISVAMRSPKAQPDLNSIVDALIAKSIKIPGMESIADNLQEIKKQDNWRVLNKGTHFEDEQPEFERVDVKNVLDILENLDNQVRLLKITDSAN